MKKVILIVILMVGSVSMAQEKKVKPFYETEDYIKIKEYYKQLITSGNYEVVESLRKEFTTKLNLDNFEKIKESNLLMKDWLNQNWKSTNFSSANEAISLLSKIEEVENVNNITIKEMLPLFQKITKEVGYSTFFKKINEDLITKL